jgi:hypothetical protein
MDRVFNGCTPRLFKCSCELPDASRLTFIIRLNPPSFKLFNDSDGYRFVLYVFTSTVTIPVTSEEMPDTLVLIQTVQTRHSGYGLDGYGYGYGAGYRKGHRYPYPRYPYPSTRRVYPYPCQTLAVHREREEVPHKNSEVEFEMKGGRHRQAQKLKDLQCSIHLKADFVQHPYRNG